MTTTATKEKPIIFTGASVLAIMAGRKSQTRRVVKPQPPSVEAVVAKSGSTYSWMPPDKVARWRVAGPVWAVRELMEMDIPHLNAPYQPGQKLWVKETWAPSVKAPKVQVAYKSDMKCVGCCHDGNGSYMQIPHGWINSPETIDRTGNFVGRGMYQQWKSPLFMPRWASRLTLEVTEVRVERLQEISIEDVLAEGIKKEDDHANAGEWWREMTGDKFIDHWDKINGKKHPWKDNPWVWAISFKRVAYGTGGNRTREERGA